MSMAMRRGGMGGLSVASIRGFSPGLKPLWFRRDMRPEAKASGYLFSGASVAGAGSIERWRGLRVWSV